MRPNPFLNKDLPLLTEGALFRTVMLLREMRASLHRASSQRAAELREQVRDALQVYESELFERYTTDSKAA